MLIENNANQQSESILPVILCGGAGKRLWPLSTDKKPKQIQALGAEKSQLRITLDRLTDPVFAPPILTLNQHHQQEIERITETVTNEFTAMLIEPVSRNTALPIFVAALLAMDHIEKGRLSDHIKLLILPADQHISPIEQFVDDIKTAAASSSNEAIITFGIKPSSASPHYGYIQPIKTRTTCPLYPVQEFLEKPDQATAEQLVKNGNHLWNSGIFLTTPQHVLQEAEQHAPNMLVQAKQALDKANRNEKTISLCQRAMQDASNLSFDHAVMEKTEQAFVMPASFDWSDIGSWSALWTLGDKDEHNTTSKGEVIYENVSNSLIYNTSRKPVRAQDLDNITLAVTDDGVVLCPLNTPQSEKHDWGQSKTVFANEIYSLKELVINPNQTVEVETPQNTSIQWTVIKGRAEVSLGNKTTTIQAPASIASQRGEKLCLKTNKENTIRVLKLAITQAQG